MSVVSCNVVVHVVYVAAREQLRNLSRLVQRHVGATPAEIPVAVRLSVRPATNCNVSRLLYPLHAVPQV